ncbi:hypothetical protein M422DRAFT_25328 [Sphaerobolus stellatus SS14]|nr:hypothetical protein M422DRAFT_25328 [Sphaerobolus stellatus SS14]
MFAPPAYCEREDDPNIRGWRNLPPVVPSDSWERAQRHRCYENPSFCTKLKRFLTLKWWRDCSEIHPALNPICYDHDLQWWFHVRDNPFKPSWGLRPRQRQNCRINQSGVDVLHEPAIQPLRSYFKLVCKQFPFPFTVYVRGTGSARCSPYFCEEPYVTVSDVICSISEALRKSPVPTKWVERTKKLSRVAKKGADESYRRRFLVPPHVRHKVTSTFVPIDFVRTVVEYKFGGLTQLEDGIWNMELHMMRPQDTYL